ncbi:Chitinase B [Thalassocella blandensis]|nr:Chitinase B [Thalassocella blandensis]
MNTLHQIFSPHLRMSALRQLLISFFLLILSGMAVAQTKVVAYYPTWSGNINDIQYEKLTHINYSFALPTHTGGLQAFSNGSRLHSLVSQAHSHGVKVLIAIGGWNNGDDSAFISLASRSDYRQNFVQSVVDFVQQYNLDGVDIDWEYPNAGAEANNFTTLMQALSSAMHSRGKLLTAAVTANDFPGSVNSAVINAVDFLNLMVYDLGNPHSSYAAAENAMNHWRYQEGLPKEKAVLGLPFYSRAGGTYRAYKDIIAQYGSAAAYNEGTGGLDYNGIPTIQAKTQLALETGGGVMFWELSQDTLDNTSLLSAIWDVVSDDTTPPSGPIQSGSTYRITSVFSAKSLDVEEHSLANGGNIQQWSYGGGNNQKWVVTDVGNNLWQLRSVESDLCLDVAEFSQDNSANIQQWSCAWSSNQSFYIEAQDAGFYIRASHSNKCLDVSNVSNEDGANIHQWECLGQNNAKWTFDLVN